MLFLVSIRRATLILLPLLGLHYGNIFQIVLKPQHFLILWYFIAVVMPFRPEAGAPGEIAYQIVSAIFTSFQVSY